VTRTKGDRLKMHAKVFYWSLKRTRNEDAGRRPWPTFSAPAKNSILLSYNHKQADPSIVDRKSLTQFGNAQVLCQQVQPVHRDLDTNPLSGVCSIHFLPFFVLLNRWTWNRWTWLTSSANRRALFNHQMTKCPRLDALLRQWHGMLGLSRQSPPSWYRDQLHEELQERKSAPTRLQKLSETADVFFSISRARHDGFPVRQLPPVVTSRHALIYADMLAKYTLRWQLYRTAASLCNAPRYDLVREVVNPSKATSLQPRHELLLSLSVSVSSRICLGLLEDLIPQ
jgi:hypothetical protein